MRTRLLTILAMTLLVVVATAGALLVTERNAQAQRASMLCNSALQRRAAIGSLWERWSAEGRQPIEQEIARACH